jgi:hypothetical protein
MEQCRMPCKCVVGATREMQSCACAHAWDVSDCVIVGLHLGKFVVA